MFSDQRDTLRKWNKIQKQNEKKKTWVAKFSIIVGEQNDFEFDMSQIWGFEHWSKYGINMIQYSSYTS